MFLEKKNMMGQAEGTKLHARRTFWISFYPIELKLCSMIGKNTRKNLLRPIASLKSVAKCATVQEKSRD